MNISGARTAIAILSTIRGGARSCFHRGQEHAARNGYQVRLTIDLNLQNIVENEIDAAMQQFHPKKATIILMRPQTGEMLAMANRPNFDLNDKSEAEARGDEEPRHQRHDGAGLDLQDRLGGGGVERKEGATGHIVFCENGVFSYGGSKLHDHKPIGELTVQDILVKSSNIGAAKTGDVARRAEVV